MREHSASERSVGYLFLMCARVATNTSPPLFGQFQRLCSRKLVGLLVTNRALFKDSGYELISVLSREGYLTKGTGVSC